MENISKNKSIIELEEFILNEFPDEHHFYHFAIIDIKFNVNEIEPELEVELEHYNKADVRILFLFKGFILYLVTNESYECHIEHKSFYDFSFLSISQGYYDKNIDLNINNPNSEMCCTYRLVGQNFMVDVFTDVIPEIQFFK
jgi:hypothetical protein